LGLTGGGLASASADVRRCAGPLRFTPDDDGRPRSCTRSARRPAHGRESPTGGGWPGPEGPVGANHPPCPG